MPDRTINQARDKPDYHVLNGFGFYNEIRIVCWMQEVQHWPQLAESGYSPTGETG